MDDEEMADAIMESMPAVDWSELATKSDLELLSRELRAEMGETRVELRNEFVSFQRTMVLMMIGLALTIWISLLVA